MKIAPKITLDGSTNGRRLTRWSRGRSTPARLVLRAKIVLAAAEGKMNKDIAAELATSKKTVSLWRSRFAEQRLAGIEKDAPAAGGRKPTPAVDRLTTDHAEDDPGEAGQRHALEHADAGQGTWASPADGAARLEGQRPEAASDARPSSSATIRTSRRSWWTWSGCTSNPPEHALVLCCDEKSQIQALDRTQTGSAAQPGPLRHDDPRLQAQRHDDAVRRHRTGRGQADRHVHAAASPSGVDQVPEADRRARRRRNWTCT